MTQFGDTKLQAAQPRVERPVPVAIAVGRTIAGSLVTSGADQPFHVGLHQQLHNRLGHTA